jgi:hypothetical protein
MARIGKCTFSSGCSLASRDEIITVPDGAEFVCPECERPLIKTTRPGTKPVAIQAFILGGISLLTLMGAGAVYVTSHALRQNQPANQIGTSFEQAEVAAQHGEYMPSRHLVLATPSPAPSAQHSP